MYIPSVYDFVENRLRVEREKYIYSRNIRGRKTMDGSIKAI